MKNILFFSVFLFPLFSSAQVQCQCDMTDWHQEQNWKPDSHLNNPLVKSVTLYSEKGFEMLCIEYQNGECCSRDIAYKGTWKIVNIANTYLVIEKVIGYKKQAYFDFVTKEFVPQKITQDYDGPHTGHDEGP